MFGFVSMARNMYCTHNSGCNSNFDKFDIFLAGKTDRKVFIPHFLLLAISSGLLVRNMGLSPLDLKDRT